MLKSVQILLFWKRATLAKYLLHMVYYVQKMTLGGMIMAEYEKRRETPLGRIICNRELPILKRAKEVLDNE